MQIEEQVFTNNNSDLPISDEAPNAPAQYLWKKEFSQEEIAKLKILKVLFFDKADYPNPNATNRDVFRDLPNLFIGGKRASNLQRSNTLQSTMQFLLKFINLQDQHIAAYIVGTNFQTFNLNLIQEIIQTQLLKFRTIQAQIKTPKKEYPTTNGNVVTLNILAEIHDFFFMQNPKDANDN